MVRNRLRDLLGGYLDTQLLGVDIDEYLVSPALGDDRRPPTPDCRSEASRTPATVGSCPTTAFTSS
jgi:hypothetical protein